MWLTINMKKQLLLILITTLSLGLYSQSINELIKQNHAANGDELVIIKEITDSITVVDGKEFIKVLTNKGELYLVANKKWVVGDTLQLENSASKDSTNILEAEKRKAEQAKIDTITLEEKHKQEQTLYKVIGIILIGIISLLILYRRFRADK